MTEVRPYWPHYLYAPGYITTEGLGKHPWNNLNTGKNFPLDRLLYLLQLPHIQIIIIYISMHFKSSSPTIMNNATSEQQTLTTNCITGRQSFRYWQNWCKKKKRKRKKNYHKHSILPALWNKVNFLRNS